MPSYKEKKQRLKQLVKQEEEERIRKIQQDGHAFKKEDAFRIAEKHYKSYVHIKTDFSKLLDINTLQSDLIQGHLVHKIAQPQGAYIVKKFINQKTQYQVGFEALNDYIRKPYRNNLDGTNGLYFEDEQKQEINQAQDIEKLQEPVYQQKKQNNEVKLGYEKIQNNGYFFNEKIRMANLGFQYDWPHRTYPKTQVPIPPTVTHLTARAKALYQILIHKQSLQYHGEAVIVNFYKPKDYMIGHLDDGQQDQINPIFSFCFGLSCVFLLGFPDKSKQPVAIRLEAGDLLIMSGYSRICYHGVPRIIEDSYKRPHFDEQTEKIKDQIDSQKDNSYRINGFEEVANYFQTHRLNVNVRQVWARPEQINENGKFEEGNLQLTEK